MQQTLGIDQLSLSQHRQGAAAPKVTPERRRRIQAHGFIEPTVVRPLPEEPGKYEILSDPEDYLAAGKLGLHEIPVVIRTDLSDEEAAEIVRSRCRSANDNPIDEAERYQEELDRQSETHNGDVNIARLARLTGKSRSQISRTLALLTLPEEVQDHFRRGDLSAAHGRFLVKLSDPLRQASLARRAVVEKLSVRDLESIVNKKVEAALPVVAATPAKGPDLLRLERNLTDHVGCPVTIDLHSGTLSINYFKNLETLDGIIAKLGYRDE